MRTNKVFNRRNAVMGWIAWHGWKKALKLKAQQAKPSVDRETKKPNKGAIAVFLAGVLAVVTLRRLRSRGGDAGLDG